MNKVFFTSDNHYHHFNIRKYTGRPDNVDYMMLSRHNAMVGKEDIVYNLGDFAFTNLEQQKETFDKLNGRQILIKGNHDGSLTRMQKIGFITPEAYLENSPMVLHYGNVALVLTHKPMKLSKLTEFANGFSEQTSIVNVHGHIHNNAIDGEITETKDEVYLDVSWVWARKNTWYYNVSVEVTDYKPVTLSDISSSIKEAVLEKRKHGILN